MSAGLQRMLSAQTLQFPEGVEGMSNGYRPQCTKVQKSDCWQGFNCQQHDKDFAFAILICIDLRAA